MHDLFTKDLGWKLFSLLLAAGIWLAVHRRLPQAGGEANAGNTSKVTYGDLPVQIVSAKADVRDFRVAPATVKVEVIGPSDLMDKLQESQIRASVNLTDMPPDADLHQLVDVAPPAGVTVVSVEPARVAIIPPPKP